MAAPLRLPDRRARINPGSRPWAAIGGIAVVAGAASFALKHSTAARARRERDHSRRVTPPALFAAATVIQRHFGFKAAIPAFTAAAVISARACKQLALSDRLTWARPSGTGGRAATFELGRRRCRCRRRISGGGLLSADRFSSATLQEAIEAHMQVSFREEICVIGPYAVVVPDMARSAGARSSTSRSAAFELEGLSHRCRRISDAQATRLV